MESNIVRWTRPKNCRMLAKIRNNHLWHQVEKITVFLDAHALTSGVVLVDLLGHNDANAARVRIAKETAERCDDIFVVATSTVLWTIRSTRKYYRRLFPKTSLIQKLGCYDERLSLQCTYIQQSSRDTKREYSDIWTQADADIAKLVANNAPYYMVEKVEKQAAFTIRSRNERVTRMILGRCESRLDPD